MAAATGFDASLASEMPKFRVSPAAGWWLRTYGVLPSQVPATGPKGFILKGDVLMHIKQNNLSIRPRDAPATAQKSAPTPAATPKKQSAAKKPQAASPAFNPDDPFQ